MSETPTPELTQEEVMIDFLHLVTTFSFFHPDAEEEVTEVDFTD